MLINIFNLSDLTVKNVQQACSCCFPILFENQLNPDDPPAKLERWLQSVKQSEINGDAFRYVLWNHGDHPGPIACVLISRSEYDPNEAVLHSRFIEEGLCSGLVAAMCQEAINQAFDSGFANQIIAHASLTDPWRQRLYPTIPLVEFPAREDTCIEDLAKYGLAYAIRADDPVRSTWDVTGIMCDAEERFRDGWAAVNMIRDLMQDPSQVDERRVA